MKREDLLRALEIVKPGLANKEMIEQTTSFAFIGNRVVTYNDEISISTPVAGLSSVMSGAVRAEELYKLLGKIRKEDITIEQKEKEIIISAGRSKAGLIVQNEIRLPLEDLEKVGNWKPIPDKFLEAVNFTMQSCSKDTSRTVLTCVNVRKDGCLESTDNYRITRYKLDDPMPIAFMVPYFICKDLINYPVGKVAEGKGWVHFKTKEDDTIFSCRVYAGDFPDIGPVLDVKGKELQLPNILSAMLERAAVFAQQESKDEMVSITLANGRFKVKARNPYGWFEEDTRIDYNEKPFSFQINPVFLGLMAIQLRSCIISQRCMKFSGDAWEHVVALTAMEF